tara:strand:- start:14964 stop:16088 length:1125 start_codon:yes stop_codon:yes gene_type:complete
MSEKILREYIKGLLLSNSDVLLERAKRKKARQNNIDKEIMAAAKSAEAEGQSFTSQYFAGYIMDSYPDFTHVRSRKDKNYLNDLAEEPISLQALLDSLVDFDLLEVTGQQNNFKIYSITGRPKTKPDIKRGDFNGASEQEFYNYLQEILDSDSYLTDMKEAMEHFGGGLLFDLFVKNQNPAFTRKVTPPQGTDNRTDKLIDYSTMFDLNGALARNEWSAVLTPQFKFRNNSRTKKVRGVFVRFNHVHSLMEPWQLLIRMVDKAIFDFLKSRPTFANKEEFRLRLLDSFWQFPLEVDAGGLHLELTNLPIPGKPYYFHTADVLTSANINKAISWLDSNGTDPEDQIYLVLRNANNETVVNRISQAAKHKQKEEAR